MEYLNALATFLVGLFAFFLYSKQKHDNKKVASTVIYHDVVSAERKIQDLKKGALDRDVFEPLIPVNNWTTYRHLFVNDLDDFEIESVSNFYQHCEAIDYAAKQLLSEYQIKCKIDRASEMLVKMADEAPSEGEFIARRAKFLKTLNCDDTIFNPQAPMTTYQRRLSAVSNLTGTPAGSKLKYISKMGWFMSCLQCKFLRFK